MAMQDFIISYTYLLKFIYALDVKAAIISFEMRENEFNINIFELISKITILWMFLSIGYFRGSQSFQGRVAFFQLKFFHGALP